MLYSTALLMLLFNHAVVIESIRCGYDCPFVFSTFNFTIPKDICKNIVQEYTQCLLILELDFDKHGGGSLLTISDPKEPDRLEIKTEFGFNSTKTTIHYFCSMSDNCAWEFLHELFTPPLVGFGALAVQAKLHELLYNSEPNSSSISCTNHQCSSHSYCQAYINQSSSFENNSVIIDNHLSCINASTHPDMIKIEQTFFPFQTKTTTMTILCNRDECDQNSTILQAYEIIMNEFILPVNYSIFNTNTTVTTTTARSIAYSSYFVLSHIRMVLASAFVFLLASVIE